MSKILPIRINAADNKHCKYLYNKVLDHVQREKLPAVFATDYIDLSTPKQSTLEELKKWGIKFFNLETKK